MLWLTLQQLKSSKVEARIEAARKLGVLKEKKAASALIESLQDENHEVRLAVIDALRSIAHPAAAEPLCAALTDVPKRAKGRPSTKGSEAAECEALAAALAAIGTPSVHPLLDTLRSEEREPRRWAAQALGLIKAPQAVTPLAERLEDPRSDVRKAAARALGDIGDPSALKPLMNALANKDPETRRAAAEALATIKQSEVAVPALSRSLVDPAETVQLAAIEALRSIGGLQAATALRSASDGSARKSVREAAGSALKSVRLEPAGAVERAAAAVILGDFAGAVREGKAAIPSLAGALGSRDAVRRRQATDALVSLHSEEALGPLLEALKDHDPQVQASAARGLAIIGRPALAGLVNAVSAPDASVQREAARALGQIRDPNSANALVEVILRNRSTTEEYPDSLEAARAAAAALEAILSGAARQIEEEQLRRIAAVPDCTVVRQWDEKQAEVALDCTRIRDLAKGELDRRGG